MIENKVIDPASVIISEIDNASSIAGLMLTTAGAIADVKEDSTSVPSSCSGCH